MTSPPDWTDLADAYGAATPVRELLGRAEAGDQAAWGELWSRLCHQGTVYSASYAALPRLTEMAEVADGTTSDGRNEPLHLATAILASSDGPAERADVRTRYAEEVAMLGRVARAELSRAQTRTEFGYGVQALLAAEKTSVWSSELAALADRELGLRCPACREVLLVELDPPAGAPGPNAAVDVQPADPDRLTGAEACAYQVSVAEDWPQVAAELLVLFGTFRCPACGTSMRGLDVPA